MNKLKLLLFSVLLIPVSIKADCTNQEITKYKSLSGNIDYYYEYNGNFDITLYNLSSELYVRSLNTGSEYSIPGGIGETRINGITPGTAIKLAVYPRNDKCSDYRVRTIYVNLPYYNKYYQEEICENNTSSLCSKWVNTSNYSREQFIEQVKKTKKTVEEEKETEEDKTTILEHIGMFIGKYYILILLVVIAGGSFGIYRLNKKDRFDF